MSNILDGLRLSFGRSLQLVHERIGGRVLGSKDNYDKIQVQLTKELREFEEISALVMPLENALKINAKLFKSFLSLFANIYKGVLQFEISYLEDDVKKYSEFDRSEYILRKKELSNVDNLVSIAETQYDKLSTLMTNPIVDGYRKKATWAEKIAYIFESTNHVITPFIVPVPDLS